MKLISNFEDLCKKGNDFVSMYYIIRIVNYLFSFLSFGGLCYYMYRIRTTPIRQTLSGKWIQILIVSEMIVCITHFMNILKDIVEINSTEDKPKQKSVYMVIYHVQIFLGIFADLTSITISLLFSMKAYDTIKNHARMFTNDKIIKKIYIIIYGFPIIITLIVFIINYGMVPTNLSSQDDDCKTWSWVHSKLSIFLYVIFWSMLIASFVLSILTIAKLKYVEKITDNENSNSETSMKRKIVKVKKEIFRYPVISLIIWGLLSLDRIFDDFVIVYGKGNSRFYEGRWRIVKYILIIIANFIAGVRGLLYVSAYLCKEGCSIPQIEEEPKENTPLMKEGDFDSE